MIWGFVPWFRNLQIGYIHGEHPIHWSFPQLELGQGLRRLRRLWWLTRVGISSRNISCVCHISCCHFNLCWCNLWSMAYLHDDKMQSPSTDVQVLENTWRLNSIGRGHWLETRIQGQTEGREMFKKREKTQQITVGFVWLFWDKNKKTSNKLCCQIATKNKCTALIPAVNH